ncbi:MAG: adenine phosphoribosyltransferase [Deltaproteobacteria bacterium]|nr:adenine phosphoribosyltransferase [Deltaproteobacteria bacterium]
MNLKDTIRSIPGWPIEGVIFGDLTTLMQNPTAYKETCDIFYHRYKDMQIDKVVGIDARGFVFGAVLAYHLNVGFIPVRKKGKLPYHTISENYALEYGENTVEIHADAIDNGERVVIIDDLIATGGTIEAAVKLVKKLGGDILECGFIVELPDLKGREKIKGENIFSICEFEGD